MVSPYLKNAARVKPGTIEEQNRIKDVRFSLTAPDVYQAQHNYGRELATNLMLNHDNGQVLSAAENEAFASIISTYWGVDKELVKSDIPGFVEKYTGIKVGNNWLQELGEYASTWRDNKRLSFYQFQMNYLNPESEAYKKYSQLSEDIVLNMAKKQKTFKDFGKVGTSIIEAAPTTMQLLEQLGIMVASVGAGAIYGASLGAGALISGGALGGGVGSMLAGSSAAASMAGAVTGAGVGQQLNLFHMDVIEAGGKAYEMRQMVDESGNPLFTNEQIANASLLYAAGIHLIEGYTDKFVDPIVKGMGLGQISGKLKGLFSQNFVGRLLEYGFNTVGQSVQEGLEGAWSSLVDSIFKDLVPILRGEGFTADEERLNEEWNEIKKSAWEDFSQSLTGFGIGGIPSALLSGMTGLNRAFYDPTRVTAQAKFDAKTYFDGGTVVDINSIDTMGEVWSKEIEESVADHKSRAIFVTENPETRLYVPITSSSRGLVATLREMGAQGASIILVDGNANESMAQYYASQIDGYLEEVSEETTSDDVDTSLNDIVYGTSGNTIILKNKESLSAVEDFFRENEGTDSIIHDGDSLKVITDKAVLKIRALDENESVEKVTPVRDFKSWANLEEERYEKKSASDPYKIENYLQSYLEREAFDIIDKAFEDDVKGKDLTYQERRSLEFSKLGAARITPIVAETFNMSVKDVLDKFTFTINPEELKYTDDEGKIKTAYGGMRSKGGKYNITINKTVRPDTIMHEIIHGLRRMASAEQLKGFVGAKGYTGAEGAMWVDDIYEEGGVYKIGDKSFSTYDEAYDSVRSNEEQFVDDFMRYLFGAEGFNEQQKSFFEKVHEFFLNFWNSMRDILSQNLDPSVVRAFDILFSESGDPQEKSDFVEVAVTEGFGKAMELQDMGLEDAIERDAENGLDEEGNILWQIREKEPPKETGIGYKVFYEKGGKLYPPMVANPNGEPTPVGVWLDADAAPVVETSKTGRPKVKAGGKGTQGGSGTLAYRPGWHLGEIPYAIQFNRLNPETGEKDLFPANFVWAEVEYAKDKNYQQEAESYGYNEAGNYQHSLAGLPYLPTDGYYKYRTNPNPETDPWIITGAMKINKVLSNEEVDVLVREAGREPQKRQMLYQRIMDRNTQARIDADYEATESALRADETNFDSEGNHLAPNGNKSNLTYRQWVQTRTPAFMAWFGDWINDAKNASKAVDENGEPKVFLHGSVEQFDTFDKSKIKANETDAPLNGFWFTDKELIASPAFRTRQYLSEFFLNVRNPAEYTTRGLYKLDKELIRELWDEKTQNWNPQSRSTQDEMRYRLQAEGYDGVWFAKRPDLSSQEGQKLVKWTTARGRKMSLHLKEDGYYYLYEGWDEDSDAFVTGGWKTATEYANQLEENTLVVFEPNQIKSATDNSGAFSTENDSILYQTNTESENFKNWFKDSKVVDENGKPLRVFHGTPRPGFTEFSSENRINGGDGLYYFTDSADMASQFALEFTEGSSVFRNRATGNAGGIYPVYLSMQNPLDFRNLTEKDKQTILSVSKEKDLEGADQYLKYVSRDIIANLADYGYDGIIADMGRGATEYAVVNQAQIKSIFNKGLFNPNNRNILDQTVNNFVETHKAFFDNASNDTEIEVDHSGRIVATSKTNVTNDFVMEDLDSILPDSGYKDTLFQLINKDSKLKVNVKEEQVRTFKISLTPAEYDKFLKSYEDGGVLKLDFTSEEALNSIRQFGVSEERLNDTRDYYRSRQDVKYVSWSKEGVPTTKNVTFGLMNKKTMLEGSKVRNTPIFALTKGCGRARILIERVENGVMSASTLIESCYGGSCFVDKQRDKIQYLNEYIVSKEMVMPTTKQIERWFYWVNKYGQRTSAKDTVRKFIADSDIIREGAMGCSSHAFVIMDYERTVDKTIVDGKTYYTQNDETREFEPVINPADEELGSYYEKADKSLAEVWLDCMKSQDIRVTDKNNKNYGKPVQTIFITAGYAPVTDEAYERLLPYKEWFKIHTSLSGYFDGNELAARISEFEKMNDLGLEPMIRLVTNIDGVEYKDHEYNFENEVKLLNYLYNRIPVDERPKFPKRMEGIVERREQTQWEKDHPIHIWQFLETPFHNDTIHKTSSATGLFGVACCAVSEALKKAMPNRTTGMCNFCVRGCGSRDQLTMKKFQDLADKIANIRLSDQREADLVVTDEDFEYETRESGTDTVTENLPLYADSDSSEPMMLFQLSDEDRKKALEARKNEIKWATEGGSWIRTEYIEEFAGEDWADDELNVRTWMKENPGKYLELRKIATEALTYDIFKERLLENNNSEWTDEDEKLYRRLYTIAQTKTSEEKNAEFIKNHVIGDDNLLALAKLMRGYSDLDFVSKPKRRSGGYYRVIGQLNNSKGISSKVKALSDGKKKERSTASQIQEAREIIMKNPKPYRMAFEKAMLGENNASLVKTNNRFDPSEIMQAENDYYTDYELRTLDDRIEDELITLEEENEKLKKKAESSKARKTDWKKNSEQLEKKLAQAQADIKRLNTENLQKTAVENKLRETQKERNDLVQKLNEVQEENKKLKKEKSEIKSERNERRKRVAELRKKLSEANTTVNRLKKVLDAIRRRDEALEAKREKEALLLKIKDAIKVKKSTFGWGLTSCDAKYAPAFNFLNGLFAKEDRSALLSRRSELIALIDDAKVQNPEDSSIGDLEDELENVRSQINGSEMAEVPDLLKPFTKSLHLKVDNRISKWTLEELSDVLSIARQMREQAQSEFLPRYLALQTARNKVIDDFYMQTFNVDVTTEDTNRRDVLNKEKNKEYLLGIVGESMDKFRAWNATMARLARHLDGEKEGVIYDYFVRKVRDLYSQELNAIQTRLEKGNEEFKRLGLKTTELNKILDLGEGYTFLKDNGEKVNLTVDQAIGVYIYSMNEDGLMKLRSLSGNAIPENERIKIISALTPEQKEWGLFMMSELDSHWKESADTLYNVYNLIMGKVDNYFTFKSAKKLDGADEGMDIFTGASGDTVRYTNKGFTKERVTAVYPLDLNVSRTWTNQVKKEEHFVYFAKFARDANYMVSKEKTGLGEVIDKKYGEHNRDVLEDYIKYIVSPKSYTDEFDKAISTIVGRGASAMVAGNLSVMLKQIPTGAAAIGNVGIKEFFTSVISPNVNLVEFLKANELLYKDYDNVKAFIDENDPVIRNRRYGTELIEDTSGIGRSNLDNLSSRVNSTVMKYSAGFTDGYVARTLWLARYKTVFNELKKQAEKDGVAFDKGKAHKEAVFKAGQLISETQNTSVPMDMSYAMRKAKSNPFMKPFYLFASTSMNIFNMLAYDTFFNNANSKKKNAALVTYIVLNMLGMMAISGTLFKKDDEDTEEYAKRIMEESLSQTVVYAVPGFGGSISNAIKGYKGSSGEISLIGDLSEFIGSLKSDSSAWEKFGDLLFVLSEGTGLPANAGKKIVKSAINMNPGYLINKTWADILEGSK